MLFVHLLVTVAYEDIEYLPFLVCYMSILNESSFNENFMLENKNY